MKRFLAILMVISLCSCGEGKETENKKVVIPMTTASETVMLEVSEKAKGKRAREAMIDEDMGGAE